YGAVQLDLPRRRPGPREHPHLRRPGLAGARPAPAPRRGRRHGHDLRGELRDRVGRRNPSGVRYPHVARRIDFYDDPDAPRAHTIVPSANVVVVNDAGEILMIRRTDNDHWALPGGAMDLGESLS